MEKFNDSDFIKNNDEGYYIWKKKHEILLRKIYFLQNIGSVLLRQKKEREAIKERRKLF